MINSVVLVGRLTKEVNLRKTGAGNSIASFSLAVNRRFVQNNEQSADFINCVAWRQQADFLAQYTKKGTQIGLEGRIQTRSYDDSAGRKIFVTEVIADNVVILESKKDSNNGQAEETQDEFTGYFNSPSGQTFDVPSDDLPF